MNYIINYISNPLPVILIINIINGIFVYSTIRLLKKYSLPNYIILTIIIGFFSAIAEVIFSVYLLRYGLSEIFFGFIIGTFMFIVLGVGGTSIIINKGLPTKLYLQKRSLAIFNISVAIFAMVATDGIINSFEGLLLILMFFILVFETVQAKANVELNIVSPIKNKRERNLQIFLAVICFASMILLSEFAANNLKLYFIEYYYEFFFIGFVIIAPLFAVPELFYEIYFNRRNFRKINFGDLFVSSLTSLIFTTGLVTIFYEVKVSNLALLNSNLIILIVTLLIFNFYAYTERYLKKLEGFMLIIFLIIAFIINFLLISG